MDIVECLRATTESNELNAQAVAEIERLRAENEIVAEIERLRAENEIFRTALKCADVAMAGAPIWHTQHRVLSDVLIELKKALADAPKAAEVECHTG